MRIPPKTIRTGVLMVAAAAASACGTASSPSSGAAQAAAHPTGTHTLVGTFGIAAGECSTATAVPTGSWFEMLGRGGAVVKNSFGGCADASYTPLKPGTKGGLVTAAYEPSPTPAFSGSNAMADEIIEPVSFFGSNFSLSTQAADPQTGEAVPKPSITSTAGALSGNLEAMAAAYNGAYFNQGSPKPGGTYTGTTKAVSGTISCSGEYTVRWQSQIVGGAFNDYTGVWHLVGTFTPVAGTSLAKALGC